MPTGIVILGARSEDKGHLFIRVSDDLTTKGIKAGELVKALAPIIEGTGGGKPNSAQAGGKAPHKIPDALEKARELI